MGLRASSYYWRWPSNLSLLPGAAFPFPDGGDSLCPPCASDMEVTSHVMCCDTAQISLTPVSSHWHLSKSCSSLSHLLRRSGLEVEVVTSAHLPYRGGSVPPSLGRKTCTVRAGCSWWPTHHMQLTEVGGAEAMETGCLRGALLAGGTTLHWINHGSPAPLTVSD